jgi:hypothetical protein
VLAEKKVKVFLKLVAFLRLYTRVKENFKKLQFLRSLSYLFHFNESLVSSVDEASKGVKMF